MEYNNNDQTLVKNSHLRILFFLLLAMVVLIICVFSKTTKIDVTLFEPRPCFEFCLIAGSLPKTGVVEVTGTPLLAQSKTLKCTCENESQFEIDLDDLFIGRNPIRNDVEKIRPKCELRSNTERTL